MTPGQKLKKLREERNWTQKDVCDHIGLRQSSYSKYEQDQMIRPNMEIMTALAKLFDTTVDELMADRRKSASLPPEIMKMVQDPEATPFIIDAYLEYKKAQLEKAMRDNNHD
jgi:transcriptional regulator with XRE-family HTH domain